MAKTFNTNQTPATSAIAMYNLKVLMIAAGWVVKSSGDATSFFSASDGITSGNSGAGGLGNTNAWFRIQDAAGLRELVFQRCGTNQNWWIKYSATSKFTGGSPSATVAPTATDGQNVLGTSNSGVQLFTGAESSMRYHCMAENAAPYTFYIVAYAVGGSTTKGLLMMDSLQTGSYVTGAGGDDDPVVFGVAGSGTDMVNASGSNTFWTESSNTGGGVGLWAWIKHGLTGAGWVNLAYLRLLDNASTCIPGGLGANPYNGKDELFTPFVARQSAATAPVGWKGALNNLRFIATQRAQSADTLSASTTNDYLVVERSFALPFDGSTPLN